MGDWRAAARSRPQRNYRMDDLLRRGRHEGAKGGRNTTYILGTEAIDVKRHKNGRGERIW